MWPKPESALIASGKSEHHFNSTSTQYLTVIFSWDHWCLKDTYLGHSSIFFLIHSSFCMPKQIRRGLKGRGKKRAALCHQSLPWETQSNSCLIWLKKVKSFLWNYMVPQEHGMYTHTHKTMCVKVTYPEDKSCFSLAKMIWLDSWYGNHFKVAGHRKLLGFLVVGKGFFPFPLPHSDAAAFS